MAAINIRVDDDVKQQAEFIFGELGLSTSSAITMFLKQVIRCNGIPFDLKISHAQADNQTNDD